MDFFDAGLAAALAVSIAGGLWRMASWLRAAPSAVRTATPAGGGVLASLAALVSDVLLLHRTARTGWLRWAGHTLIFVGFLGLLLFHAMDDIVSVRLFDGYDSPLDPWQWLRNLGGFMVLAGVAVMAARRLANRRLRRVTRLQDWAALAAVVCIVLSGFALETSKIISPAVYGRMVEDYFFVDEPRDAVALKTYWAHENGVVFPVQPPPDADMLAYGEELNADSCAVCHSPTASAFVSRSAATVLTRLSLARMLNRMGADVAFWYVHVVCCFLALAALPFGKFFHPVSAPANLFVRGRRRTADGRSPRRLGLDACTRCGECSLRCSVAPIHTVLGNADILPSEKLVSLKRYWGKAAFSDAQLRAFAEGSRICTECLRCTEVCSAGINLQDLWLASKPDIGRRSPDPNHAVNTMAAAGRADSLLRCAALPDGALSSNAASFWACVQCTTCTSVCPVVAVSKDPTRDLDLAPQQIMNLLRMGLTEQAMGARMVWSCTTCYKCQEYCPQNIRVADILYELRQAAAVKLRGEDA